MNILYVSKLNSAPKFVPKKKQTQTVHSNHQESNQSSPEGESDPDEGADRHHDEIIEIYLQELREEYGYEQTVSLAKDQSLFSPSQIRGKNFQRCLHPLQSPLKVCHSKSF